MNRPHFQNQINRLVDTFGAQQYKRERVELLWREIGALSDFWMTKTVDRLIGECRQAPLLVEFREEASKERERTWSHEKVQNARDAKEFFLIADDPDFRGTVLKTIVDRMNRKVPDAEWDAFMKGLDGLVKSSELAAKGRPA